MIRQRRLSVYFKFGNLPSKAFFHLRLDLILHTVSLAFRDFAKADKMSKSLRWQSFRVRLEKESRPHRALVYRSFVRRFFVLRHQKHREQIAFVFARFSPFIDNSINYSIEGFVRTLKLLVCGRGNFSSNFGKRNNADNQTSRSVSVIASPTSSVSSSTFALKRVLPTICKVRRIISLSISRTSPSSPFVAHFFGIFGHRFGIFGYARAVKCGLDHPALFQMFFTFAGQKSFCRAVF